MLEASEAAEHIGKVSVRSWQYWEAGRSPVPEDVSNEIGDLANMRARLIDARIAQAASGRISLNYYRTLDDFALATGKASVPMWRLTQSVVAELYARGLAELVESGGLTFSGES